MTNRSRANLHWLLFKYFGIKRKEARGCGRCSFDTRQDCVGEATLEHLNVSFEKGLWTYRCKVCGQVKKPELPHFEENWTF